MDIEKLKTLIADGKTYKEMATLLSVSPRTIKNYANKIGMKIKTKIANKDDLHLIEQIRLLVQSGLTNLDIARKLKISPTTTRKYTIMIGLDTNSVKKKSIKFVNLSNKQLEIIYGSMLGDMSLSRTKKKARFSISQGGGHEFYFDHVCKQFDGLLGAVSKTPRFDNRTKKFYNKFTCRFLAHETYNQFYDIFYKNGIKTITREWLDKLTWQSIAYWFMDDGCRAGIFATNCFSKNEVELLQETLLNKFKIKTRIKNVIGKEQWVLCILPESRLAFDSNIKPYVTSDMLYKLKYH